MIILEKKCYLNWNYMRDFLLIYFASTKSLQILK